MRKMVYVSGKLSDPRGTWFEEQNTRRAEEVSVELMRLGIATHCPHLNTHLMGGLFSYQTFIDLDLAIIDHCDAVVMMDNWKDSQGALLEHTRARMRNLPIFYWPADKDKIEQWQDSEPFQDSLPQTR